MNIGITEAAIAQRNDAEAECARLRQQVAELVEALAGTVFALGWHTEKHGVAMDQKYLDDARAVLAKAKAQS